MNASPEPESDFESLIRQRASRLAAPDPAWRDENLGTVQNAAVGTLQWPSRSLWRTKWFPLSLAACWVAVLVLNWSALKETGRFSGYADARAVPMVLGCWNEPVLLASVSVR